MAYPRFSLFPSRAASARELTEMNAEWHATANHLARSAVPSTAGSVVEEPEPEPPAPEPEPPTPKPLGGGPTGVVDLIGLRPDQAVLQTSLALTIKTVADEALDVVHQAEALTVTDADTCVQGEQLYDVLRAFEATVHEHYDAHCDRAHKLWKGLTDERGRYLKPIELAKKAIGDRVATWKFARQQAETAEQRRIEQRAREEQQQSAARTATQLEQQGDAAGAREVREEAKVAPAPLVPRAPSAVPSTGTTSTKKSWEAVLVDWTKLRAAIGNGECAEFDVALQACLLPLLNRQATVLKGELGKRYPGVEGRIKPTLAGR